MPGTLLEQIRTDLLPLGESTAPFSLAMLRGGELACHAGGIWPSGRPALQTDRFYGASLAKQVTGVALAQLVSLGRLDPDARLSGLVAVDVAATVRQVLHHIGGLPAQGVLEAERPTENWTDASVMGRLPELAPFPAPGMSHVYSNAGYVLLARILEAVTGRAFADHVAAAVFGPSEAEAEAEGMAFAATSGTPPSEQWAMLGASLPLSTGDGGLWTTAAAFAQWLDRQNRDALAVEHLVTQPGVLSDGGRVAYGWGLGLRGHAEAPVFIHGGSWHGAAAKSMRCPALGLSVVGLAAGPAAQQIVAAVDAVFARLGGMP